MTVAEKRELLARIQNLEERIKQLEELLEEALAIKFVRLQ